MNPSFQVLQRRVDAELKLFLEKQRMAFRDAGAPEAKTLVEEIRRVLRAGGKRLRPAFCYWGFRAAGGSDGRRIMRAAAALELLHTAAIIHDDIMDDSSSRRGQPTSHVQLGREVDATQYSRFGPAAAILAGDLALTLAYQLLAQSGFRFSHLSKANEWYYRMLTEMIGGQYLDLVAVGRRETSEKAVLRIAALKSGAYTIEKPLLFGAALGQANPSVLRHLSKYGRSLGLAFQLRDDILGAFGSPLTGKNSDEDFVKGKRTVLIARALASLPTLERESIEGLLGREDLTSEEADCLRGLLKGSGALDQTLTQIRKLTTQAKTALNGVPLPVPAANALQELASLLERRDY